MVNQKILIPIGESDLEMFSDLVYTGANPFTWTFKTDKGLSIDVELTNEYCWGCRDTDDLEYLKELDEFYCKDCLEEEKEKV